MNLLFLALFFKRGKTDVQMCSFVSVCCCLCTHIGVSAGLGIGANARSNVFGHTALMDCVLAYCQTKDRTVRDGE